jgi:hypothetical protein
MGTEGCLQTANGLVNLRHVLLTLLTELFHGVAKSLTRDSIRPQ